MVKVGGACLQFEGSGWVGSEVVLVLVLVLVMVVVVVGGCNLCKDDALMPGPEGATWLIAHTLMLYQSSYINIVPAGAICATQSMANHTCEQRHFARLNHRQAQHAYEGISPALSHRQPCWQACVAGGGGRELPHHLPRSKQHGGPAGKEISNPQFLQQAHGPACTLRCSPLSMCVLVTHSSLRDVCESVQSTINFPALYNDNTTSAVPTSVSTIVPAH